MIHEVGFWFYTKDTDCDRREVSLRNTIFFLILVKDSQVYSQVKTWHV